MRAYETPELLLQTCGIEALRLPGVAIITVHNLYARVEQSSISSRIF